MTLAHDVWLVFQRQMLLLIRTPIWMAVAVIQPIIYLTLFAPMLKQALDGPADVVMTDMAAPTTGHRATDHIRTITLVEIALDVALDVLKPGGAFVTKAFQGGETAEGTARLKQAFAEVRHVKPKASRAESSELYILAKGRRART